MGTKITERKNKLVLLLLYMLTEFILALFFHSFILFNSGNVAHRKHTHVDKQTRN